MNIFSAINNYIKQKSTFYGDFYNKNKEEIIKRDLTPEELTYFNIINENNHKRLYEVSGNNNLIELNFNKNVKQYISGIGTVQQIM